MYKIMKTLFTIMAVLFFCMTAQAQENFDSLSAELYRKAQQDLLNKKENLIAGKEKFRHMKDSIKALKGMVAEELIEMQIDALEKGIDDIEDSIEEIEDQLEKLENSGSYNRRHYSIEIPRYDLEIKSRNRDFESHLTGIFFAVNGLMNPNSDSHEADFMNLNESRSFCLDIYFAGHDIPFCRKFGMTFGCDLEFNHYSLAKDINLIVRDGQVGYENSAINYKRQNFRLMYLNFPLVFEFNVPSGREKFYINAGIKGGVRVGSRIKQIYDIDGEKKRNRIHGDFQSQLFRYAVIGGIGYDGVQVFAEYSPLQLFKDGRGPELYPFAIGVKFNF